MHQVGGGKGVSRGSVVHSSSSSPDVCCCYRLHRHTSRLTATPLYIVGRLSAAVSDARSGRCKQRRRPLLASCIQAAICPLSRKGTKSQQSSSGSHPRLPHFKPGVPTRARTGQPNSERSGCTGQHPTSYALASSAFCALCRWQGGRRTGRLRTEATISRIPLAKITPARPVEARIQGHDSSQLKHTPTRQ